MNLYIHTPTLLYLNLNNHNLDEVYDPNSSYSHPLRPGMNKKSETVPSHPHPMK